MAIIVIWLAACIAVIYFPFLNQTPLTVVFALPVVLFIPGYCLIAALFPKNDDISLIERIALSFGSPPPLSPWDRIDASYRDLHLWINVSSPSSFHLQDQMTSHEV